MTETPSKTTFEALKSPFQESQWEWRIQKCKWNEGQPWALVVPYVDARAIQNRLDEVVGPENWSVHYRHENGGVMCSLAIKVGSEWVAKQDGSDPTDNEPFKGAISKSLVRAAVAWGIGRHFYEMTPQFAQIVPKDTPHAKFASDKESGKSFHWIPPSMKPSPGTTSHPTNVPQGRPSQETSVDPGEFVITFGKKYNGLKLKQIPTEELQSYAAFLEKSSEKDGKPLSRSAHDFIQALDKYLDVGEDDIPF